MQVIRLLVKAIALLSFLWVRHNFQCPQSTNSILSEKYLIIIHRRQNGTNFLPHFKIITSLRWELPEDLNYAAYHDFFFFFCRQCIIFHSFAMIGSWSIHFTSTFFGKTVSNLFAPFRYPMWAEGYAVGVTLHICLQATGDKVSKGEKTMHTRLSH